MDLSSNGGVSPGFRLHPTDEELLHYYLKTRILPTSLRWKTNGISSAKRIENTRPGQGQTVRATHEGFWKATGRDKCIRNSYQKIGMRKTLVFYKRRAHHGQKTDWIMHEYRLEDADDPQRNPSMDWVACEDVFSEVIIDVIADVDDVLNGENHMDARC
ncbi:unnamed protein product [Brassica oleracea var. botrytis]|uniref:(rape) hypothetical protein n=1 Tax=Brassica napus TaxID=3708 RepID=A0A078JDW6_BRANA|nr:unnamed protein product [Brassica napus]CDY62781.1 BnaCnng40940D [Brassica napus]